MQENILALFDVKFTWRSSGFSLSVPEFTLKKGQHLLLTAPSGAGKSTLLSLIAGLIPAASGELHLAGKDIIPLSQAKRDQHRAETTGFIFQSLNLLPYLSALDNILLPLKFSKSRKAAAGPHPQALARDMLSRIGLPAQSFAKAKSAELSIGQQQRVAALRALIGAPQLLIADEPTSALDAEARARFVEMLFEEADRGGTTVLMVSHDAELARAFPQQLSLSQIAKIERQP